MTVAHQIKQELAHICAIDLADVRDEAWLIEYGLDSMRSLELIMVLEEHFDIELPDEAIARVRTVADLVRLIEQQRSAR